ncbi:MAG: YraN family protein, partial [Patescibacteria group bacterium]
MPSPRQKFGTRAEQQAADFLLAKGMNLIDRHVTSRFGEIDLLMQDGATVVAVEVKARRNARFGRAVESMTQKKLANIAAALHQTLEKRGWQNRPYRIDIITVEPNGIEHLKSVGP